MTGKSERSRLAYLVAVILALAAVAVLDRWQCVECSEMQLFMERWRVYVAGGLLVIGHVCLWRFRR